jgi:hypothetical protein
MAASWLALIDPISTLLDKIVPDKDARDRLAHEISTMAETHSHEIAKAQIAVNQQEAAHKSIFVAGWRPFTGWSCSLALSFNFLVLPMGNFVLALNDSVIVIAPLDLSTMMPVLLGMLGLGGMRSYEKRNKVARER